MSDRHINGFAKGLIEEIIKADMSMHERQIEAWAWMNGNQPTGDDIPRDIMKGLSQGRYLSINEVDFKFHIKAVPIATFRQRLRLAYKLLYDENYYSALQPLVFDICGAKEEEAHAITLHIKRLENGKIKASYEADDELTAKMMQ